MLKLNDYKRFRFVGCRIERVGDRNEFLLTGSHGTLSDIHTHYITDISLRIHGFSSKDCSLNRDGSTSCCLFPFSRRDTKRTEFESDEILCDKKHVNGEIKGSKITFVFQEDGNILTLTCVDAALELEGNLIDTPVESELQLTENVRVCRRTINDDLGETYTFGASKLTLDEEKRELLIEIEDAVLHAFEDSQINWEYDSIINNILIKITNWSEMKVTRDPELIDYDLEPEMIPSDAPQRSACCLLPFGRRTNREIEEVEYDYQTLSRLDRGCIKSFKIEESSIIIHIEKLVGDGYQHLCYIELMDAEIESSADCTEGWGIR